MDEKESILIVDDDESTRIGLKLIFDRKGYETAMAGTGREALGKAHRRFFNGVLLDIRLPDMEGVELVAPLKEMHPDMVVIMVTAYASLENAVQALNEGASAYITKPLRMDEVLVTVREALEKQRLTIENRRLYQEAQRELAERKRAQAQLTQRTNELESALQQLQTTHEQLILADRLATIGQLVSGVAHELNNPLTSALGYAQLLLGRDLDQAVKDNLETIYRETQRAARIIENLLSFARQRKPERNYISINEALGKVLEMRAYEMKVNNIEVITDLQPDLPNTLADLQHLQQVFFNILVNAEQAMAEARGKGRLLAKSHQTGQNIQVIFADDGPGISRENLSRVFDPFFTTKEVGKGTGLGLSICYGIIQEHGGRIWADSEEGKGATFTIEIPVVREGASLPA